MGRGCAGGHVGEQIGQLVVLVGRADSEQQRGRVGALQQLL